MGVLWFHDTDTEICETMLFSRHDNIVILVVTIFFFYTPIIMTMSFKDMMRGLRQKFRCLCLMQCCITVNDEFEQKFTEDPQSSSSSSSSPDNISPACSTSASDSGSTDDSGDNYYRRRSRRLIGYQHHVDKKNEKYSRGNSISRRSFYL